MNSSLRLCGAFGLSLALFIACDSTVAPTGPVLLVPIDAYLSDHFCTEVSVTQGDATATQTTCGRDPQPTFLTFPCTAPATVAIVHIPTSSEALGYPMLTSCTAGSPCTQTAACRPDRDTTLTYDLTVMRDANQGFFDIVVDLGPSGTGLRPLGPDDVADFCVDMVVRNSVNEVVWDQRDICSSQHGSTSVLDYVGPCDAANGGTSVVEVTLVSATNSDGVELEDVRLPCTDGMTCTVQATCEKNIDVTIRLAP